MREKNRNPCRASRLRPSPAKWLFALDVKTYMLQKADNRIKNTVILWCRCNLDDDTGSADNKSQTSAEILPVICNEVYDLHVVCGLWVREIGR